MAEKFSVRVDGTTITLKGDDVRTLNLQAQLMTPSHQENGLTGSKAQQLAIELAGKDKRITPSLITLIQEKKDLPHPAQAAQWLLKNQNNLLTAFLWRQDQQGGPVKDYTV